MLTAHIIYKPVNRDRHVRGTTIVMLTSGHNLVTTHVPSLNVVTQILVEVVIKQETTDIVMLRQCRQLPSSGVEQAQFRQHPTEVMHGCHRWLNLSQASYAVNIIWTATAKFHVAALIARVIQYHMIT